MTVAMLIALLNEASQLEPVAFSLVTALVTKLKGKTDAEILAGDSADWAAIVVTAHKEALPK